jgi:4-amino-4-deoxy-L-arabinose transferase-like glycosyltransferase
VTKSKLSISLSLVLLGFILFFPGVISLPTVDRDEAHFAQASRQMVESENYFQIRFQEKTRFQKPPGINWLQALSVKFFSNADSNRIWPYRIPSTLGALLSLLLLFLFAQRFVGQKVALLGTGLLASTLLLNIEAHMAVIDTSLLSSVLLMQGALWVIYEGYKKDIPVSWGWALLFWLAMAYGMVLKGVTPLVGLLTLTALSLYERKISWAKNLHFFYGALLFAGLTLYWVYMVNQAEHSNYLLQMIHKDLLPKLTGGHESHGKPPLFHLAILPLTFWPACLFFWQGAHYVKDNFKQPTVLFLLAWILPTWIFFECMPTKLPQYVLPTFPAIALLCALGVAKKAMPMRPNLMRVLQFLWWIFSVILLGGIVWVSYFFMNQLTLINIVWFTLGFILITYVLFLVYKKKLTTAAIMVVCLSFLIYPYIFAVLLPQINPLWITPQIEKVVKKEGINDENPLYVAGYAEPSVVFGLGTRRVKFVETEELIGKILQTPKVIAVVEGTQFNAMKPLCRVRILQEIEGFNYSKGKWVQLFLITNKHLQ